MQLIKLSNEPMRAFYAPDAQALSVGEVVAVEGDTLVARLPWVDGFTMLAPHRLLWDRKKASAVTGIGLSRGTSLLEGQIIIDDHARVSLSHLSEIEYFSMALVQLRDGELKMVVAQRAAIDYLDINVDDVDPEGESRIGLLLDRCKVVG